jgi:Spy/CpxP family protein refolding chaperone
MKKIIVSALIAVMVAGGVQAQDQQPRREGPQKGQRARGAMKQLNLSEQQKADMKSINEDFRKQLGELRKNEDITVKEWKSRMESIRKDHQSKFNSILTDEQKTSIEKMKTDRKEGMHKRGNRFQQGRKSFHYNRSGPGRMNGEKMKAELGLTADQSAALQKNRADNMAKMKALREDKSLSPEQKKAEIKKFHEQQKESLKSILTPEQLQKLQQHKSHRQKPVQS